VHIIVRLWTKFTIIGILLILSLSGTVYAARATLGAVHSFTVQQTLSRNGDVRTIRPWMTITYIGHMCRVSINYLDDSLGVERGDKHFNYVTLYEIATYSKQSDTAIVQRVQKAILNYRQHKPPEKPRFILTSTLQKVPVKLELTPTPRSKKLRVRPQPTPTPRSKKPTGRKA
jgi:hypothetical protein